VRGDGRAGARGIARRHTREDYPNASPEWRKINLILTLSGDQVSMVRQPLPTIRPDLLALFAKSELKKYMTDEELADLPESASDSAGPRGGEN
jgi:succinate dehydrogenase / fumarate reductase flavoprotein subunit